MTERALVTGCAGFIGSHLSERLIADGWEVVGVDCFTPFYDRDLKERNLAGLLGEEAFHLHTLDLSADPLEEVVDGVDVVYHLAAQAGVRGSFGVGFGEYVRHNVHATQRLLEAVARRPLQRFVYASSSSVYGDPETTPTPEHEPRRPRSPYGMTKVATEELAALYHRNEDVPVVGLRYFTVYGPRQRPDMAMCRFLLQALAGQPLVVLGDGRQMRDFTFVGDAVRATLAAARLGRPGAVYNVGGGTPVELRDMIELLGQLLGREIDVRHADVARGDVRTTCSDARRARAELGWSPRMALADGLAAQLETLAPVVASPR